MGRGLEGLPAQEDSQVIVFGIATVLVSWAFIHNRLVRRINASPDYKPPKVLDGAVVGWEKPEWIDEWLSDWPWRKYYLEE